jgi:hypothetical protein
MGYKLGNQAFSRVVLVPASNCSWLASPKHTPHNRLVGGSSPPGPTNTIQRLIGQFLHITYPKISKWQQLWQHLTELEPTDESLARLELKRFAKRLRLPVQMIE